MKKHSHNKKEIKNINKITLHEHNRNNKIFSFNSFL